jgi:glutamyl-tRNA synthetase
MIEAFDLAAIGRSASRFDFDKLKNMNGHFMRASDDGALFDLLMKTLPYLPDGQEMLAALDDRRRAQLRAALPGLKERAKTLVEFVDGAKFLFQSRPLPLDADAETLLAKGGRLHLKALLPRLSGLSDWSAASTEAAVRAYAEETGAKLGVVAQPIRAAVTGRTKSIGSFDLLGILGREESLGRLEDQASV